MMRKTVLLTVCVIAIVSMPMLAVAQDQTISFGEGEWDADAWTSLRLPLHEVMGTLVQRPDSLGTNAFTDEEKKAHLDNVLLMTDTGMDEGEFEVVFRIGPETGTAPGVFLSPTYDGDALQTAIAVFVADYTMAVWEVYTDPETQETGYVHLFRMNRYQDPAIEHVVRCRYSKGRKSMAFQVDDSDVVMLRLLEFEINSKIGIWGCHGTCDFYTLTMRPDGTLPWKAVAPVEEQ